METQQITITEEAVGGSPNVLSTVELPVDEVTVRELIRSHVHQTAKDRQLRNPRRFERTEQFERGDMETALNGPQKRESTTIDWKAEFEKACQAFLRQQILILVDGKQMTELDEKLKITTQSDVRFLRLTLLMGG